MKNENFLQIISGKRRHVITRKFPWLAFVEVYYCNRSSYEVAIEHLLHEVVCNELFISWVETITWWQLRLGSVKVMEGLHEAEIKIWISVYT